MPIQPTKKDALNSIEIQRVRETIVDFYSDEFSSGDKLVPYCGGFVGGGAPQTSCCKYKNTNHVEH